MSDPTFAADLVNDPFFKAENGFTIRRYTVTVDQDGMAVTTFTDIPAQGSVVPSGALGVTRTQEMERQGSEITIYSEAPIQTGNEPAGLIADNIIYNGLLYEVTGQDDYFEWGFNTATAVLASPGGRPLP